MVPLRFHSLINNATAEKQPKMAEKDTNGWSHGIVCPPKSRTRTTEPMDAANNAMPMTSRFCKSVVS